MIIANPFQLALSALLIALLSAGWSPARAEEKKSPPPMPVIVAPATLAELSDRVEALGTARANESVVLTANVSEKIRVLHFTDGQQVEAGDVLVELEHAEEDANLAQAIAVLRERQLALQRVSRLEKGKLVAPDAIDRARLEVEQAEANIRAIQARIDDRVIRAPFAGIVGLRQVSVGSLVEVGDPIINLDDTHVIKLDFTVPSLFLPELKPGTPIRAHATALAGQSYNGEVASIDSRIDPVTRSIRVRALLPNPDRRILPGMLLQVDLLRNMRQALTIPEAALLPQGEKEFVMLRVSKDYKETIEKKPIRIGTRTAGKVEVLEGLREGDQVVTHGNIKLKPGAAIKVLAVDDGSVDITSIIKGKTLKGN